MSISYLLLPEMSAVGSEVTGLGRKVSVDLVLRHGRGFASDREGAWYWGSGSAGKDEDGSAQTAWRVNVLQGGYS